MRGMTSKMLLLLPCAALFASAAVLEPPPGKHYLGAWLDYPNNGHETPVLFNTRMGPTLNASYFHVATNIPDRDLSVWPKAAFGMIDQTQTDAIAFLSVYLPTPDQVTDLDIDDLARLCHYTNLAGRRLFLRFAPEMNGNWQPYGQKPALYVSLFQKVARAVRSYTNETALVWSPNVAAGYPFAGGAYAPAPGSADFLALDTNNNGQLDAGDDPFAPFYPGDEYVDWVSLSIYYFGPSYPWKDNIAPNGTNFESQLQVAPNFYETYAAAKNKPMIIAETAAAFHLSVIENAPTIPGCAGLAPGPLPEASGELAVKRAFWGQTITSADFLTKFPLIKGFGLFEFTKPEECTLRDFTVTNNTAVLEAFKTDLTAVAGLYEFGNHTTRVINTTNVGTNRDPTSPGPSVPGSRSTSSTNPSPRATGGGSSQSGQNAGVKEGVNFITMIAVALFAVIVF